jgi:hypothetical protein
MNGNSFRTSNICTETNTKCILMDMVHILREYMNGVFVKLKRYHRTQFYRKYLSPQEVPPHPILPQVPLPSSGTTAPNFTVSTSPLKRYHRTQFCRKYLSPQAVPPHPILPVSTSPLSGEDYSKASKILSFMLNLYKSNYFLTYR